MSHRQGGGDAERWREREREMIGRPEYDSDKKCAEAVNLDTNVDIFLAHSTSGTHTHNQHNAKRNTRNTVIRFAYWISIGQNNKFAEFLLLLSLMRHCRFYFLWNILLVRIVFVFKKECESVTTICHKLMPKIESWTIYEMRTIWKKKRTTTIIVGAKAWTITWFINLLRSLWNTNIVWGECEKLNAVHMEIGNGN